LLVFRARSNEPRSTIARSIGPWFDPVGSGTIFFAAFTGVLLWVSSLFAGWFENWIVFRRVPEAIEHHRFGKRFGHPRMAKLARSGSSSRAPAAGAGDLGRMTMKLESEVRTFAGAATVHLRTRQHGWWRGSSRRRQHVVLVA
jgi:hypothetical protein